MKSHGATASGILGGVMLVITLGFAITRGRDRDMNYYAQEQCRDIRFSSTADSARAIAAQSGGTVTATPQGFTLRFERRRMSDVGCDVVIERGRVKDSHFKWFDR